MRPASEAERTRQGELFAELCRVPSPSWEEAAVAERVTAELRGMGLEVERDEAGNLLARVRGRSERTVLLCAHLDTVPPAAPIEPVLVDDGWENANAGILGADNKSAVAMILAVARRVTVEGSPVGLELLFTVAEEIGLLGAKRFDASQLRADFGYVFDHATPIGELVTASPTLYRGRGRLPRQVRARRAAPGGGPLGDPRGRPRRDRDATRAHRRPDDGEHRLPARRRGVHQRGPGTRPRCSPRSARSTPTRSKRSWPR